MNVEGKKSIHPPGFALIVTVSLMVLLALLGVGLLSLSTVSLRSSARGAAMAEARGNARLGLMLALGQLQKQMGDDRRISRLADQIPADAEGDETAAAPGRRFWVGAYDAWDDESEARPEPELRAWLVSDAGIAPVEENLPTSASGADETVQLLGSGTAGDAEEDRVEAPLLPLTRDGVVASRIGWWIGDEGAKAMLATPPTEPASDLTEVRNRLQAAPHHGVRIASTTSGIPFENLDRTDHRLAALTDWPQTAFFTSDREAPRELFHDLATRTGGLLVNVREGGFRRDLAMRFETPPPRGGSSGVTPLYTVNDEEGINMEELASFYRLHEELQSLSGEFTTGGSIPRGTLGLRLPETPAACLEDEAFHLKMPVVVSLQLVISLRAEPVGTGREALNRVQVVIDPILTFWNPLDVPVEIPSGAWMTYNFFQFPYTLDVQSGRQSWECPLVATLSGATTEQNADNNFVALRVGQIERLIFKPGEVIKVSQSGDLRVEGNRSNHQLQGKSGFNHGGGVARPLRDRNGATVDVPSNATLNYTMKPNGLTSGKTQRSGQTLSGRNQHTRHFGLQYHEFFIGTDRPNAGGVGYGGRSIDFDFGNTRARADRIRFAGTPGTKPPSDRIYADRREHADVFPAFDRSDTRPLPVAQLLASKAPVLMYSYSAKTELTSPTGTRSMLRFNPRAHRVDYYDLSQYELDLMGHDYVVEPLVSWVNRKLETSTDGNAYFGGSYDAADGRSFVITHSVPREPVHSLAALQHSTANGFLHQQPIQGYTALNAREPMLPQISHPIGNSFAPSVMAPEETSRSTTGNRPVADHSYLANRALWDDWFFSSVAPETSPSQPRGRSQRAVAEEFLQGTSDLPITRYRPALGDRSADDWLGELFSGDIPQSAAIDLMASLIRVEGMFNVNSTSVEAWRTLLSSLLDEEIVVIDDVGQPSRTREDESVPVTGLLAPPDLEAEGRGAVTVRDPAQWYGRRVLTEEEITELAEAIVREVRKRGPFLSLADFVNRRVGSDAELARSGAIQAALDSDEVSINEAFNTGGRAVAGDVAERLPFPEAEEGAVAAGIPGIVKQADLLTPLAPILSARSDTFRIRAYGEAVDRSGKVTARAWCEALVERHAGFVDAADEPETRPDVLTSPVNRLFGRRFQITSFRWLGPDEV